MHILGIEHVSRLLYAKRPFLLKRKALHNIASIWETS